MRRVTIEEGTVGPNEHAAATPPTTDPDLDQARPRYALEINDSIVQGLTVIKYALELGDVELAERKTEETLTAARRVITDLLTRHVERERNPLKPGSMVRTEGVTASAEREGSV